MPLARSSRRSRTTADPSPLRSRLGPPAREGLVVEIAARREIGDDGTGDVGGSPPAARGAGSARACSTPCARADRRPRAWRPWRRARRAARAPRRAAGPPPGHAHLFRKSELGRWPVASGAAGRLRLGGPGHLAGGEDALDLQVEVVGVGGGITRGLVGDQLLAVELQQGLIEASACRTGRARPR